MAPRSIFFLMLAATLFASRPADAQPQALMAGDERAVDARLLDFGSGVASPSFNADPGMSRAICLFNSAPHNLATALGAAATAWQVAVRDEANGLCRSVDYYYQAAAFAWHALGICRTAAANAVDTDEIWALYNRSLAQLIVAGMRHGRLNLAHQLHVNTPSGVVMIPVTRHGFLWPSEDFDGVALVDIEEGQSLSSTYRWPGLGVPLVVVRQRSQPPRPADRYYRRNQPFAATAVLWPDLGPIVGGSCPANSLVGGARLDLFDPLRVRHAVYENESVALAGDITAPFVWMRQGRDANRIALLGFLRPWANPSERGLHMLEPYQPGKIPLVFVHGLLGDPSTWFALANGLRADQRILSRYQVWAFNYPTGEAFLKSAENLRRQLQSAAVDCDPSLTDGALWQMVVVGHSMGGLLSKLQITWSGTAIWDRFINVPFEQVRVSPADRDEYARRFFFCPNPFVRRVVFLATPHDGAPAGTGLSGFLASRLVRLSDEEQTQFKQFKRDNPGALRRPVRRRLPTSVDTLSMRSPLLEVMRQLPVNPAVSIHTIYGQRPTLLTLGPSDRVVPVESAQHPGAESVLRVRASHTQIHNHPDTIREIKRILMLHDRRRVAY